MELTGKVCNTCNEIKPFAEFSKSSARKDGLQAKCKSCVKAYNDSYTRPALYTGHFKAGGDGEFLKRCTGCLQELPLTAYGSGGKNRLYSKCKACKRTDVKAREGTPEHKRKVSVWNRTFREKHKAQIVAYRNEERNRKRARLCQRARYYAKHEQVLQQMYAYKARNKERVNGWIKLAKSRKPELYRAHARAQQHIRRAGGRFTAAEWFALCERYGHKCLKCGAAGRLEADHVIPVSKGGSNRIGNIQPLCCSCNRRKHTKTVDYRPVV